MQTRWADMFPCMIATTSITDIISTGMGETRNGALQLVSSMPQIKFSFFELDLSLILFFVYHFDYFS